MLGDVAARGFTFAATVYLARTLGAESYGVVALAAAIALYPTELADFGISILGSRDVAHDRDHARKLAPGLITARFGIACVAAAMMVALALAALSAPESTVLAGYGLVLLAVSLNSAWILIGLEDVRPASVARVSGALVVLVATLLLVHAPEHAARVPLALFVGELCAVVLLLIAVGRRGFPIRPRWEPGAVVPVLRRALPLVGHALLGLWIFNADLVMIRVFHDRASVGIYAVAYSLVSLLLNAGVVYSNSLIPALTRLRQSGQAAALLETLYARVIAVALPAAVGGALLAPGIIETFFGARYAEAAPALAILLGCIPFALLRNVATAGIIAEDHARWILRISVYAALTATLLNLALIPWLGIVGAALATLGTEAARAFALVMAASSAGLSGIAPRRFLAPSLAAAVMALVLMWSGVGSLWASVPLGIAVYCGVLMALGAIRFGASGRPTLRV